MVKVIATANGYFGNIYRVPGDSFDVPDELWSDDKKRPRWVRLDTAKAFGGKGDHDGDGKVGGSKPKTAQASASAGPVIPNNWTSLGPEDLKALAEKITGKAIKRVDLAAKAIQRHLDENKAAPFAEAPEPETVETKGNGVTEALGGAAPDWLPPGGDGAPSQVD